MRCAVVNQQNTVINVIMADPNADKVPAGMTLISTDTAGPGWVWDGENFTDPTPPPEPGPTPAPKSITPRQCRLLLLQQGLLAQVETTIASMDEATRIAWEYALEFQRDDPLLNQLGVNLGLTSEQIDQFFIEAAKL